MIWDFRKRTYELENIDRGTYTAEEYEGCIVELQRVNQWLGDVRTLRHTLLCEIQKRGLKQFSVLDVGAGSGELLRVIAEWARSTGRIVGLTALELNETSALSVLEESQEFPRSTLFEERRFNCLLRTGSLTMYSALFLLTISPTARSLNCSAK